MKFFDRDFVSARLEDPEWESRIQAYEQHKARIWPRLPAEVRKAVETVAFHDARIERLHVGSARDVHLQLFCESSRGKSRVNFDFQIASVHLAGMGSDAVLIDSEVDELGSERFELRFIFKPDGELGIEFREMSFEKTALPSSAIRHPPLIQLTPPTR